MTHAILLSIIILFTSACGAPPPIKVATWNIANSLDPAPYDWAQREPLAVRTIRDAHPDLIGLQEILPNMRVDLERDLGDTYVFAGPAYPEADAEDPLVLVRKEAFDVQNAVTECVYADQDNVLRRMIWLDLLDPSNNHVRFVSTHIGGDSREVARVRDMTVGWDAIIVGDFNGFMGDNPWGVPPVGPILTGAGVSDLFKQAQPSWKQGSGCGWSSDPGCNDYGADTRIDWILGRGQYRGIAAGMVEPRDGQLLASDHWLVWTQVVR